MILGTFSFHARFIMWHYVTLWKLLNHSIYFIILAVLFIMGFPKLKFHSKDINKSKLFQEAIVVYNTHEGIDLNPSRVILCMGISRGGEGGERSQDFKTGLWTGNGCSVVWGFSPIFFYNNYYFLILDVNCAFWGIFRLLIRLISIGLYIRKVVVVITFVFSVYFFCKGWQGPGLHYTLDRRLCIR